MKYEQAYARLLNHGNLTGRDPRSAEDEESFLFALWKAGRDESVPVLGHLYDDLLSCLEVVNRHVNEEAPSEGKAGRRRPLDNQLINAMWYLLHYGWEQYRRWERAGAFDQATRDGIALTLWRISTAWGAVLDGDIDSLAEHVRNEELASS
jgi:hypothetical protein